MNIERFYLGDVWGRRRAWNGHDEAGLYFCCRLKRLLITHNHHVYVFPLKMLRSMFGFETVLCLCGRTFTARLPGREAAVIRKLWPDALFSHESEQDVSLLVCSH